MKPEVSLSALDIVQRARVHAALGDPVRLSIVDKLFIADASPSEIGAAAGIPTNLLAHHLRVLEDAGVVRRTRSEGDRRRTYVQLAMNDLVAAALIQPWSPELTWGRVVFVCTRNSARSQLAAAAWKRASRIPCTAAGTHPAERVHPRAIAVGRKHGLRMARTRTAHVDDVAGPDDLLIAVCDSAFEELNIRGARMLHWAIADPVPANTSRAFEDAYALIAARVARLATAANRAASTMEHR